MIKTNPKLLKKIWLLAIAIFLFTQASFLSEVQAASEPQLFYKRSLDCKTSEGWSRTPPQNENEISARGQYYETSQKISAAITSASCSGDYALREMYTFSKKGKIRKYKQELRTFNSNIEGGIEVISLYKYSDGQVLKKTESFFSLKNKTKLTTRPAFMQIKPNHYKTLQELPFVKLIEPNKPRTTPILTNINDQVFIEIPKEYELLTKQAQAKRYQGPLKTSSTKTLYLDLLSKPDYRTQPVSIKRFNTLTQKEKSPFCYPLDKTFSCTALKEFTLASKPALLIKQDVTISNVNFKSLGYLIFHNDQFYLVRTIIPCCLPSTDWKADLEQKLKALKFSFKETTPKTEKK